MIGISVLLSIRIALYFLFVCAVVLTTCCSSDLTDSLEGRTCDENGDCLTGYECDKKENICVAKRDGDSENGDVSADSGFDAVVDTSVDVGADSSIPNSDAGDTGNQTDTGFDARPCGYEIKSTETYCPTECDTCSDGVCFVKCDLEQECSDTKIICPEGFACDVTCSNKRACEGARIDCPSTYNCTVSCTAEQSCISAWIRCGDDGPCTLDCESGTHACQDTELQCKNQACEASCGPDQIPPRIKNCSVSCSTRCGC